MTEGKNAEKIITGGKILSQKDWDSHAVYRVIYEDRLYECRTKLPYLERYADEAAVKNRALEFITRPDNHDRAAKFFGTDKGEDASVVDKYRSENKVNPENDPRITIRCYDID